MESRDFNKHSANRWVDLDKLKSSFKMSDAAKYVVIEGSALDVENGVDLIYHEPEWEAEVQRFRNEPLTYARDRNFYCVDLKTSIFPDFVPIKLIDHISIADPLKPNFKIDRINVALESWISGHYGNAFTGQSFTRVILTDFWVMGEPVQVNGLTRYTPKMKIGYMLLKDTVMTKGPQWIKKAIAGSPNFKIIATKKGSKSATAVLYVHRSQFPDSMTSKPLEYNPSLDDLYSVVKSDVFKYYILSSQRHRLFP